MSKIWTLLMNYCVKKGRVVNIMDREGKDVYMIRYILFKTRFLSFYVHRFLKSDLSTHHDHPWNFFTYVIFKGYTEELMEPESERGILTPRIVQRTASLAYRKAETIHRVILDREYQISEQSQAPLTCCLLLKRRRIWGFIESVHNLDLNIGITEDPTGYNWTNWKDFLGITKEDPRFYGSE